MTKQQQTEPTDRDRIDAALDELAELGYGVIKGEVCCQSCGVVELEGNTKYVYYHEQDAEVFSDGNFPNLSEGMYLSSENADYSELKTIFRVHGLRLDWDGDENKRIKVFRLGCGHCREARETVSRRKN